MDINALRAKELNLIPNRKKQSEIQLKLSQHIKMKFSRFIGRESANGQTGARMDYRNGTLIGLMVMMEVRIALDLSMERE